MEKKTKSKSTLFVLLLILMALPIISLIYSYKGEHLRKTSLQELHVKGALPQTLHRSTSNSNFRYRIITTGCDDVKSMEALISQFIDEKIEFLFVNDSLTIKSLNPILLGKWNKKNILQSFSDSTYNLKNCELVLANANNEILNTYNFSDSQDKTKLVEHIAFLITKK